MRSFLVAHLKSLGPFFSGNLGYPEPSACLTREEAVDLADLYQAAEEAVAVLHPFSVVEADQAEEVPEARHFSRAVVVLVVGVAADRHPMAEEEAVHLKSETSYR
jgi:hypothetical protein